MLKEQHMPLVVLCSNPIITFYQADNTYLHRVEQRLTTILCVSMLKDIGDNIPYLVVRPASDVLGLIRVVPDTFEYVRFEQRQNAHPAVKIPDDARSICRSRNALLILTRHLRGMR